MHRELVPSQRYRVTFSETRCVGVAIGFTATFVAWRPDIAQPTARWRDRAVWDNGVEIGPRAATWRAEPAPSCGPRPGDLVLISTALAWTRPTHGFSS